MDIELMVKLRDKIKEFIEENCEDAPWEAVYHGENLEENMTLGAIAVYDMSVNTSEYCRIEKVYQE